MGLSPEEIFRLIRCCPNIQVLLVQKPVEEEEEEEEVNLAPTNVNCNAAKFTAAFEDSAHDALPKVCDNMVFPELTHLELLGPERRVIESQNDHVASLCSMLERSHSRLTHLTIHFIPFISAGLLRLFLSVPSVTTLEIKEPPFHNKTLYLVLRSLVTPVERDAQAEGPVGKSRKELKDHCGEEDTDDDRDEHDSDGTSSMDEDSDGESSILDSSSEEDSDEEDLDEEDLDEEDSDGEGSDEEDDIIVPEGQCLLPRLKDLTVVVKSCDYSELLLKVVRSRWRLDDSQHPQACSFGAEACVYLQKLRIYAAPKVDRASFETLQIILSN
ncbi:hypothetical protein BT96DRAFT_562337 [Gymnopus androsaceus JB14]|uniref:F-box domain-containing protein n=1 Tax=Gymnopus androsaceus JB14 TaxID=1447944 RepID=A0A6A4I009_9AGAR|nr:hypothetical protein BT96DRAFT_562337 [Gymnopus androsaceus JB14]